MDRLVKLRFPVKTPLGADLSSTTDYDWNGNLTSDGLRTFTYDPENRLSTVSGSASMTLTYDPLGRLRQTVSGGATTQYLYEGDRLTAEYDGSGNLLRRYVHGAGIDEPIVWYEGPGLTDRRWLHTDERGSVIAHSDGAGGVAPYVYGTYGEQAMWTGSRFSYTGQAKLTEVKLYHYKARVYDPELGRFLQTDPVGYDDDVNLYAYTRNDPLNLVDPNGGEAVGAAWLRQSNAFADRTSGALGASISAAERIAMQELMKRPSGHNDAEDAMRHAEWSRRMASEIDPAMAFLVGWQHELAGIVQEGQPLSEFYMDLNNNREGRRAAAQRRAVEPNSLVTSAEDSLSSAASNEMAYLKGMATDLANGRSVSVGSTTVKFNQDKGILVSRTERTGSRIAQRREVCIDNTKCK